MTTTRDIAVGEPPWTTYTAEFGGLIPGDLFLPPADHPLSQSAVLFRREDLGERYACLDHGGQWHDGEPFEMPLSVQVVSTHLFYFTFGHGQPNGPDGYHVVTATDREAARAEMIRRFGTRWGFCYDSEEWVVDNLGHTQEEKYGLRRVE